MKGVRNIVMMLTASAMMAGAAPPQNQSASFDQGLQAYPNAKATLELKMEPQLVLGASTRITGLIVDCISPRQTWNMLNPPTPARNVDKSSAPAVLPVQAPRGFNDNLAVHQADFALIRISFP